MSRNKFNHCGKCALWAGIFTFFIVCGIGGFYYVWGSPKVEIIVLGVAQKKLPPDQGRWEMRLSAVGGNREEAYQVLEDQEKAALQLLAEAGIPEADTQVGKRRESRKWPPYGESKNLASPPPLAEEHQVSESLFIETAEIGGLEKAIAGKKRFKGTPFNDYSRAPTFERRNFDSVGEELLLKAREHGWMQAKMIIKPGQKLRPIREEVFFPGRPDTLKSGDNDSLVAEARVLMTFVAE